MKTFKQFLTEAKAKKGQKVIDSGSGIHGKIVTISGDGNVCSVSWSNGKESEIIKDKMSVASGPYKKNYDWELTEAKENIIKIIPIEEGGFDYIADDDSEAWSKLEMFIVKEKDLKDWENKNKIFDWEEDNIEASKLTTALHKKKLKSTVKKVKVNFDFGDMDDIDPSTKEKNVTFIYPELQ